MNPIHNDPFMQSYIAACSDFNPRGRYSPAALLPVTLRLYREYDRGVVPNLSQAEIGVRKAAAALANAVRRDTRKRCVRELFYATARCNAIKMVLGREVQGTPRRRAPGVASKRSAARYEHTWRTKHVAELIIKYEELKARRDRVQEQYDIINATLILAVEEYEMELAGRRMVNPDGRAPRGSRARIFQLRHQRKELRTELLQLKRLTGVAYRRIAKTRQRVELLHLRIANYEKF